MNTRKCNRFNRSLLLAGAAALMGSGFVYAAADGAQEQARSMLSGVAGDDVSFPVGGTGAEWVDPQMQARWLLSGRPKESGRTPSDKSQKALVADVSPADLARRLLGGRGSEATMP